MGPWAHGLMDPWAQTGPEPKRALGPNGPLGPMGPGPNERWAQKALGPNGPSPKPFRGESDVQDLSSEQNRHGHMMPL